MNKVIQMGRLVADPELRYTQTNTAVCGFKIAVDRFVKGDEKQADFFKVTAWGKTGELVQKYFTKGQKILIEGRLQNNNYEDKNGINHYSNDIVAERVYFVESKRQPGDEQNKPEQGGFFPEDDGGLPF